MGYRTSSPELHRAYQQASRAATHSLLRHPGRSMAATLRILAERAEAYAEPDNYGAGALIEDFENQLAAEFNKPASLFLPSGTLAQPIALKIHCDKAANNRIGLHPTSHLQLHEQQGYSALWGLTAVTLGTANKVLTSADLEAFSSNPNELPAAIVLELPMREIGGQLPSWDDLCAQVRWAKAHGIAVHIDGARLWQCPAALNHSLAEIAALADSVYVSFYKDIGGIAGALLLGSHNFIAEARVWVRRAGGNLINLYPYILAAQQGLAENRAAVSDAVSYAAELSRLLQTIDGVRVNPAPAQTAMFHLHIACDPEQLLQAVIGYANQHQVIILPEPRAVEDNYSVCEITIGRNAMQQQARFWHEHMRNCLQPLLAKSD
ncbi:MAG: beta-eliminating lyase-related protein [Idiomarina sp.]